MSCKRMESQLIAYMDGTATEGVRREVEKHIADCAACRARAREFSVVWGAMSALPAIEPSQAFDARLRARLEVEPVRQGFWAGILPSPRLAFAVSLLLLFTVWLSNRPADVVPGPPAPTEAEFKMIENLPVLENYDLLANFDVLSDLPAKPAPARQ